jgi:hypothetical protein
VSISYSTFFPPTVLGTAAATLYAVPATPASVLLRGARMRIANTTAAPVAATVHAVPAGGTASAGNAFVPGKVIAPNDYLDVDVPIMGPGASLQALAGVGASLTVHMLSGSLFA